MGRPKKVKEVIPDGAILCPSCKEKGEEVVMTLQGDRYVCKKCYTWKEKEGIETIEDKLRRENEELKKQIEEKKK